MPRVPADEVALRAQIQSYEDEFFKSITVGEEALQQFSGRWAEFARSVSVSYSPETMQLLHRVSLTIGTLCESLLSLEQAAQEIQRDFEAEIVTILDRSRSTISSKTFSPAVSMKRDVTLAAGWLSRNYHNPYPSGSTRDDISRRAKWPRKDVDSWFTEARKRIGWSKIRKDFFSNKRADTVQAATVFFSGDRHSLHPALESALVAMATQAKELCAEPVRPGDATFASVIQCSPNSFADMDYNPISKPMISSGLVTPPQTISPSPQLSSLSSSVPPYLSKAKRRRSEDIIPAPECPRPIKRTKHVKSGSITSFPIQLPSPATSLIEAADYDPVQEPLFTEIGRFPSPLASPTSREGSVSDVLADSELTASGSCKIPQLRPLVTPSPSRSHDATITAGDDGHPATCLKRTALPLSDVAPLRTSPSIVNVMNVQDLSYRTGVSEFSFDGENSISRHVVEAALFANPALQIPVSEGFVSGLIDNTLCVSPFEDSEIVSLSTPFDNYSNDKPATDTLQYEQSAIFIPPGPLLDFSEIEPSLNSLLDSGSALCLSVDAFSNDSLESLLMPSTMNKRTDQLAQLDALREHQARIQKQIQSLEYQLSVLD